MPETAVRSEAQASASRQNGAKSSGPKTEEGKARSSQNAVRHGLCSAKLEFDDPDIERQFDELHTALMAEHDPKGEIECAAVKKLAVARWRENVCLNMEIALLQAVDRGEACAMQGGLGLPSLNTLMRYRGRIDKDIKAAQAELRELQDARRSLADGCLPKFANTEVRCFGTNEPEVSPADAIEPVDDMTKSMNREQRRRYEAMKRKKR